MKQTWWAAWLMLLSNGNYFIIKSPVKSEYCVLSVWVGLWHLAQGHVGQLGIQSRDLWDYKTVQATALPYFHRIHHLRAEDVCAARLTQEMNGKSWCTTQGWGEFEQRATGKQVWDPTLSTNADAAHPESHTIQKMFPSHWVEQRVPDYTQILKEARH